MKKIIATTLTLCLILLNGCKNENEKVLDKPAEAQAESTQLTELISYKVPITDTNWYAFIKADSLSAKGANVDEVMGTKPNYLTYKAYSMYLASLKTMILDPNSVMTDAKFNQASKFEEKKGLFCICDSVTREIDGKNISQLMCDSTSRITQVLGLEFHEAWSLNKTTGLISKEVIAVAALMSWDGPELIPEYYFFKNKESIDLVKSKQLKK
jgi:hypothetical protein